MRKLIFCEKAYSRWLILLIDHFIVIWAFTISCLIVNKFQLEVFSIDFLFFLISHSLISLVVFVSMQIHTGMIRYSNTEDILRIFKAVALNSLLFIFLTEILIIPYLQLNLKWFYLVVICNFFIAATLLIVLRIAVKTLFSYLTDLKSESSENILIYGSDKKAILIKQAFEFSQDNQYKVIGFIDNYNGRVNKHIEQKQVYPISSIPVLKRKFGIDKIVIMSDFLKLDDIKHVVNMSMESGIKVISVPPSSQWINGRLSLNQIRDLKIEDLLQREPIEIQKDNILREISGKRVLVTGAAGSIGSEIVRQLLCYNPESVVLCDQAETPLHDMELEIKEKFPDAPADIFMANIQNYSRLKSLFNKYHPQIVFHAAAFKHVPMMENNPCEAILTNVLGTKNLADISLEYKVEKFIMISTDKAVNPSNIMGASKRLAEMYIQSLNFHQPRELSTDDSDQVQSSKSGVTKFITTRFGNVLGSNGSVVPRFKTQIEKGGPITITHPRITRYFMTISEAVQLVLEASAMGKGGEIFIFDMGEPIRIVDMAMNMIRLAGLVPEKDIKIIYTGLRPGEKLYEELLNKEESTIPTHHEKIKISKVINCHFYYVKKVIEELLELNDQENSMAIVRKMKEIIPEFKSNNSVYNELDIMVMN